MNPAPPAALADEPDHRDVRRDISCQHRQEHRLADAGARENTIRCPRQQVAKALSTRTPRSSAATDPAFAHARAAVPPEMDRVKGR